MRAITAERLDLVNTSGMAEIHRRENLAKSREV
jgi:hypothetical protein